MSGEVARSGVKHPGPRASVASEYTGLQAYGSFGVCGLGFLYRL